MVWKTRLRCDWVTLVLMALGSLEMECVCAKAMGGLESIMLGREGLSTGMAAVEKT